MVPPNFKCAQTMIFGLNLNGNKCNDSRIFPKTFKLIKFTLLVVAAMTMVTVAGGFVLRGRRRLAAGVLAGFGLGFLAGLIPVFQKKPIPFL